jgi:hypothetical protein
MLRRPRIVIKRLLLLDIVILADLMASYSKQHIQTFHTTVTIRQILDCGDLETSRDGIHFAVFNSKVSDQNQLLCNKQL